MGLFIGGLFFLFVVTLINGSVVNTAVLIQEGHVGRTKGNIGSIHNGLKESEWNHKVGTEVERLLKKQGVDVVRIGAKIPIVNTQIAVALHFDGSDKPCATGASIGHDGSHASKAMAQRWRKSYAAYFPFKWHKDNFTKNLSHYYGFRNVSATKGFLVLELGEITCEEQTTWLKPRLKDVSAKIANFIIKELER